MSTDRELLEMAAKAAGVEHLKQYATDEGLLIKVGYGCTEIWNPLTDDGDAFRLWVRLCIPVSLSFGWASSECGGAQFLEKHDPDSFAATRRAIVRAAAEIGRSM